MGPEHSRQPPHPPSAEIFGFYATKKEIRSSVGVGLYIKLSQHNRLWGTNYPSKQQVNSLNSPVYTVECIQYTSIDHYRCTKIISCLWLYDESTYCALAGLGYDQKKHLSFIKVYPL